MIKKITKLLSILSLAITCAVFPSTKIYAEENDYLEEFKENYRNTSYYEYIPRDINEYLSMDEDEVIEIFAGIKVTKRLLDENYILDIDRVTLEDLVNVNRIQPYYLVPGLDDLGTSSYETYRIVPTGYQNVTVTKKGTILNGNNAGEEFYAVNLYLSNSSIMRYIEDNYIGESIIDKIEKIVTEFVVSKIVGALDSSAGLALDIGLAFLEAYNYYTDQAFRTQLVNLRRAGKKAHIRLTISSKSVTEWTNSVYAIENVTRNGIKVESEDVAYKDIEN